MSPLSLTLIVLAVLVLGQIGWILWAARHAKKNETAWTHRAGAET